MLSSVSMRTHENRASDEDASTQHRMSPSSASRVSLLAFTRVVRETSKEINARASSATTTLEGEDKRVSQSTRRERLKGTEYYV